VIMVDKRGSLALLIAEAMWGPEAAELYSRTAETSLPDHRWVQALAAADAVLADFGETSSGSRIFSDQDREYYDFLRPAPHQRSLPWIA
jgi:hypothetical protein